MATGVTIKLLALELNISVDRLIYQFSEIGIYKTDLDYVTSQERKVLLTHVNHNQKKMNILNKLTLQRKTLSTLNIFSSGGRTKKVQVEIRKKHTYVQCDSKILQKKESDIVNSFDKVSNVLSSDLSMKEEGLMHEKHLGNDSNVVVGNDSNVVVKKNQNNNDNVIDRFSYKKKDELLVSIDKDKINMENISNDSKCNRQYGNEVWNKSYLSKKKKGNNLVSGIASIHYDKNNGNSGNNNSNKKVIGNRRFRARQRLHSFKSKHSDSKVNVNQYRQNTVLNLMKYEYDESHSVVRVIKHKHHRPTTLAHSFNKPTQVVIRNVVIGKMITIAELANKMAVKSSQVIKVMMQLGTMVTVNQEIDQQTAQLVTEEMGHRVILRREDTLEEMVMNDHRDCIDISRLECRAPVVTVMGHVDHGKTSLLDYIRSSRIVDSEAGGITQRMGAYCVEVLNNSSSSDNRKMITFLDTPGHEAFTAMRLRGVRITDIVVLVVAVDDGVMLQTIEAIQHVKKAKIPMIVALNKIDKSDSFDINHIKNDLAKEGVISEEWGGETQFVHVSAKSGIGVENLLNAILLESELLELKVVRHAMASGVVIESFLDKGRGPVANVLVREGTLKSGDVVLCGLEYGRVRSMRNELGDYISSAGPSMPVEIIGLSGPPFAGDCMVVVRDERKAREVALYRQEKFRSIKLARKKKDTLDRMLNEISNEDNKLLFNIVLKADFQGSVEAISHVLNDFSNLHVRVNVVGSGVGRINETDVSLAIATRSVLLGFNVGADVLARKVIESRTLNVYYYSVIYDLINNVKKIIDSMLVLHNQKRKNVALVEVRDVFCVPRLGNIAGCMILEGVVHRHNKVRVLRKKSVIYEGELASLRRFKDDVSEVRAGMECGISIKNYTDVRSGDLIEVFD